MQLFTGRLVVLGTTLFAAAGYAQLQTKLSPETTRAFEEYVASVEPGIIQQAQQLKPFPWLGEAAMPKARKGEIVVRAMTGNNGKEIKDGIIHDWLAGTFVPGATIAQVTAVSQNFARHKEWYPEIIDSKLLGTNNGTVRGQWLLKKKKIITVVLRTELDSALHQVTPQHAYLVSRTGPVIEVKDYGSKQQSDYPAGQGHGFLWRFNGYWTFHQTDEGVFVECRVISLSRDVPSGLGWIVNPFIRSMPKESLESTLKNTRAAVVGKR